MPCLYAVFIRDVSRSNTIPSCKPCRAATESADGKLCQLQTQSHNLGSCSTCSWPPSLLKRTRSTLPPCTALMNSL